MTVKSFLAAAAGSGRPLFGGVILLATLAGAPALARDVTLTAAFSISVAGITIGHADAKAFFRNDGTYVAAINGSTYGLSRLISDATAVLAGSGQIVGPVVVPKTYNLATNEAGYQTHVHMRMIDRAIVVNRAIPQPRPADDRIPVTKPNMQDVVDPIGAFVVAMEQGVTVDGPTVCNRTLSVFDGWQRFDVQLTYKETKTLIGAGGDSYSGTVFACSARYIPIAGHRKSEEDSQFLVQNHLEVWMAPVAGTNLLVPIHILITTQFGDLDVRARSFVVSASDIRAGATG